MLTMMAGSSVKKTFTANEHYNSGIWNVYLVDGVFMDKKLKRRTLPVINLKNLHSINILDLSVNEE